MSIKQRQQDNKTLDRKVMKKDSGNEKTHKFSLNHIIVEKK
jgi:hypothetical protein